MRRAWIVWIVPLRAGLIGGVGLGLLLGLAAGLSAGGGGGAPLPNLRVERAFLSDERGNRLPPLKAHEPFWVRVDFTYTNPVCAEYVIRRVVRDAATGEVVIAHDAPPVNWGCGYSGTTQWTHVWGGWSVSAPGPYEITVALDATNAIREAREDDNQKTFTIDVIGEARSGLQAVLDAIKPQRFYENGFTGRRILLGIIDRGWIDTREPGLDRPGKVTKCIRWEGRPDPGLNRPTGHETLVALFAAANGAGRRGIAFDAELWCAGVFTHTQFPWITSPNPPYYGLMMFGRFGLEGRKPHVLNNSWNWNHDENWNFEGTTHVTYAADAVARDGAVVVVSANNFRRRPEPPCDGWNVICVGATAPDARGRYTRIADFSNRGPSPSFFNRAPIRSSIDLVAPGDVRTPWGRFWGTSIAAPIVSGGAALLVEKGLVRGFSTDPRVIKAVLLNSASPLPGWSNSARLQAGVWTTTQPLDFAQGAGQLDLDRAFRQYDAPGQSSREPVAKIGWAFETISPRDERKVYRFAETLKAGTELRATLVWFLQRDVLNYDPDLPDPFGASKRVDLRFTNLDLELWLTDARGRLIRKVAESVSQVDSKEHIRFTLKETGRYALVVVWKGIVFEGAGASLPEAETFGLAWWAE